MPAPIARRAALGALLVQALVAVRPAAATTYYVNSRVGDDASAGTSRAAPWKGFANLEARTFQPGDSILFARGSAYVGGFRFASSGRPGRPIVIADYSLTADVVRRVDRAALAPHLVHDGAGRAPAFTNPEWGVLDGNVIRVEGSHVVVDGLYFHDTARPPGSNRTNRNVQKMGAVHLALGTSHNVVRDCEFANTPVGIKVKGTYHVVTRNYLHDAYEPLAESWGPIAIMIVSPHNEISYNRIAHVGSYGGPYGSDGGAIELDGVDEAFDGRDIDIHHNTSVDNHGFLELAGRSVDGVTVAYNLSDDRNQFLGGASMRNVVVYNNTVVRTREPNVDRYVFWTFAPESTFVTVRNNVFVVAPDVRVFEAPIPGPDAPPPPRRPRSPMRAAVHDHNLYFSPGNPDPVGVPLGRGEIVADPRFVDAANRVFRLDARSPARGKGVPLGYGQDLDGSPVPARKAPDLGAFQH